MAPRLVADYTCPFLTTSAPRPNATSRNCVRPREPLFICNCTKYATPSVRHGAMIVGSFTGGLTVVNVHDIDQPAELGMALLLFSLGLGRSFRELRPVRAVVLGGATVQVIATTALGLALAAVARLAMAASGVVRGAGLAIEHDGRAEDGSGAGSPRDAHAQCSNCHNGADARRVRTHISAR
jgi:Sodium/hydrogen exchanger family